MATVIAPEHHAPPAAFTWPVRRALLAAEWRHLVMLNYEIDPTALAPLVPAGTELDFWNGRTYASIVGFQFLNTRLFGVAVPWHINFVEVNLRFYVRRRDGNDWRRGVVFIRELAPRRAVAIVANMLYGEHYLTVPMSHHIEPGVSDVPRRLHYGWRHRGRDCRVAVECKPGAQSQPLAPGSHAEFIAEHYWGYSSPRRGAPKEYLVAHRTWRISPAVAAELDCDARTLYGDGVAECLAGEPTSAFWVDGSPVRVYPGRRL